MIFDTRPTIVGHRGFGSGESGGCRENTIDSYLAAVSHGLSWIELDVQRSLDDQLVIRHDPVTPDGDFLVTRTAEQLASYGILRFEDVMAALPTGVAVNIDAKTVIEDAIDPPHRRTAALVAEALREHQERRRLFVSSFDPGLLMTLQDRKDTIARVSLGLITWLNFPSRHGIAAAANMGLDAICVHTGTFGLRREQPRPTDHAAEHVIDTAHRAGLEVLAWVPDPADAVRLARAGADALCVDDVPGVVAALAESGQARLAGGPTAEP
jgi:glycerophosphoryl diester phosphodiesterase